MGVSKPLRQTAHAHIQVSLNNVATDGNMGVCGKDSIEQNECNTVLYWHWSSPPSRAVNFFLTLFKVKHRTVLLSPSEFKSPSYLKINPDGLVPCFQDEGLTICESRPSGRGATLSRERT